jgi:hypothetical protein
MKVGNFKRVVAAVSCLDCISIALSWSFGLTSDGSPSALLSSTSLVVLNTWPVPTDNLLVLTKIAPRG